MAAVAHARSNPVFWHAFLGFVHAFLASCNLIFFDGFVATGETRLAIVVTIAHYALAAVHAALILNSARTRPAPRPSVGAI